VQWLKTVTTLAIRAPDASDSHGPTPLAMMNPPSPCERDDQGTWMPAVVGGGRDDDVALSVDKDEGAGQATGEVAVTEDDVAICKHKDKAALSHCMMEREWHKQMKDNFTDLRSFLPNVNEKVVSTLLQTLHRDVSLYHKLLGEVKESQN
jgi:hypothetical protein